MTALAATTPRHRSPSVTAGTVALVGGYEHLPGSEAIDRRLLAEAGTRRPHVVVLLAAAPVRRRACKTREAQHYWQQFGAKLHVGCTGTPGDTTATVRAIERADLTVLVGGRPWLLHRRLDGSAMLGTLMQRWHAGMPVAGSSSGAMAMCQWRLRPTTGAARHVRPGFGMVPGLVVPHHGRHGTTRLAARLAASYPDLPVLAVADQTALVGRGDRCSVVGRGSATVRHGHRAAQLGPGGSVDLHKLTAACWPHVCVPVHRG